MAGSPPSDPNHPDISSKVWPRLASRSATATRYAIKDEVAHGGMGTVLRVWDEDLRRQVAMKVMREGDAPAAADAPTSVDPEKFARFLDEAQITGQLEHPGIVPVHELGVDDQGRIYFTMKLVKGVTLERVFEDLAAGQGGWTQTRVLGLLQRVCEALAFAHASGVIHRDLKPANVMVGSFGEVYVMDWGLAKILDGEPESAGAAPNSDGVRTDRRDSASETPDSPLMTMEGDIMGTPAFMSPEQAAGRVSEMGPPSDVYAVGAMLYQLLAGHIPYAPPGEPRDAVTIWRAVKAGPPTPLDAVAPDAPAELVSICERAMARDANDRYADMSALSEDLAAYVDGRVVRAYETGAWAEARKWVRRNKPLAAALAAGLLATVGGLAGIGYVQAEGREAERVQRERAELAEGEASDRADELQSVADFQAEQLASLDVEQMGLSMREAILAASTEEQREELAEALGELNFTSLAMTTLETNLFDQTIAAIDSQFAGQPLVQAKLLQSASKTLFDLGLLNAAVAPQERALAIRREHLGNEHDDTLASINRLGMAHHSLGAWDEARTRYEEVIEITEQLGNEQHPSAMDALSNLGVIHVVEGKLDQAEEIYRRVLAIHERQDGMEHPNTLEARLHMGGLLRDLGKFDEAETHLRTVLEVARRTHDEDSERVLTTMASLGSLLQRRGHHAEAKSMMGQALAARRRKLGDEHPQTLELLMQVSNLNALIGETDEAKQQLLEALNSLQRTLGPDHPETLTARNNLGAFLFNQGDSKGAEQVFREIVAAGRRIHGQDHPKTMQSIKNLAVSLTQQGEHSQALPLLQDVVDYRRRVLGVDHPDTIEAHRSLGATFSRAGRVAESQHHLRIALDGAIRTYDVAHDETQTILKHLGTSISNAAGDADTAEKRAVIKAETQSVIEQLERWHAEKPDAGLGDSAARLRTFLDEWRRDWGETVK